MKIIKAETKEWEEKEGYSKKIFLNSEDLNYSGALVQKVKIEAGKEVKEHYHKKQTEIFFFLESSGFWIINGEKKTFENGDILVLEPFDKHLVSNNGDGNIVLLTFKLNHEEKDFYWA